MPRVLDRFASSSSDRIYEVIVTDQNELSCNCPAWTRQTHYRDCPQTRGDKCTCRQQSLLLTPKDVRTCPHLRDVQGWIDEIGGLPQALAAMDAAQTAVLRVAANRARAGRALDRGAAAHRPATDELNTLQRALRSVDQREAQRREDRREARALSSSVRGRQRRQERTVAESHVATCQCPDCLARRLDARRAAAPATRPVPPRRLPGPPTRGIRIRDDEEP